jgi:hypothetical protein
MARLGLRFFAALRLCVKIRCQGMLVTQSEKNEDTQKQN